MKRYTILLTLLFVLMNTGCEDKEDTPADIDCAWAYYWTGAGNIVYLNSIPSINATFKWKAI